MDRGKAARCRVPRLRGCRRRSFFEAARWARCRFFSFHGVCDVLVERVDARLVVLFAGDTRPVGAEFNSRDIRPCVCTAVQLDANPWGAPPGPPAPGSPPRQHRPRAPGTCKIPTVSSPATSMYRLWATPNSAHKVGADSTLVPLCVTLAVDHPTRRVSGPPTSANSPYTGGQASVAGIEQVARDLGRLASLKRALGLRVLLRLKRRCVSDLDRRYASRTMRAWSKVRASFRLTYVLLSAGVAAAWLSKQHPAPAVIGLVGVYAALALLAGPVGRFTGLPTFRPDEAYSDTLRRWRRERGTR
jgi:hypothetical protein